MLDALVVRTAGDPAEIRSFASQDSMAVVNAMSSDERWGKVFWGVLRRRPLRVIVADPVAAVTEDMAGRAGR